MSNPLHEYRQVDAHSGAAFADSHQLVQMLLDGAIDKIAIAKGHMERKETADKGAKISQAISIIDGLRISLNLEAGGEIAANLDSLYEYMGRRLIEANLQNDASMLDEVRALLREVRGAWGAIPDQVKNASQGKGPESAEAAGV